MCSLKRSWRSCAASPRPVPGDLIRYFMLSTAEETFVRKFRGQATRWAPAVQLCTLPWLGFVPDEITSARDRSGALVGGAGSAGWGASQLWHPRADPHRSSAGDGDGHDVVVDDCGPDRRGATANSCEVLPRTPIRDWWTRQQR